VAAFTNVPGEDGTVLPFDPDANGPVRSLAVAGDTVFLGGSFTELNGALAALLVQRRNAGAVDATTGLARPWNPDLDGPVNALALEGDTVFAGGEFATVNGAAPRQRLAAFDTAAGTARQWNPGAGAAVRSLALHGSTVFAGGDFAPVALDAQSGAPEPLPVDVSPEGRNGPPLMTRVDALFATPETGLLAGGSFAMNSGALRTADLARFGLPRLPGDGADETGPTLALAASHRRFRVGRRATPRDGTAKASAKRRRKTPRGTTLRLRLSEPARVRVDLFLKAKGKLVRGKCVKPSRANRSRRRCTRLVRKGTFRRTAPAGRSRVAFSGRIGRRALKPGRYRLRATPTDAAGNVGAARSLSIRIVR
jgi:hypothetical protein